MRTPSDGYQSSTMSDIMAKPPDQNEEFDHAELEEAGAALDDLERISMLSGGMDDPDDAPGPDSARW